MTPGLAYKITQRRKRNSHPADTEDGCEAHFPRGCHLESPQHGHWECNHDEIENEIDDGHAQRRRRSIQAGAALDAFVPVKGKWGAQEEHSDNRACPISHH